MKPEFSEIDSQSIALDSGIIGQSIEYDNSPEGWVLGSGWETDTESEALLACD